MEETYELLLDESRARVSLLKKSDDATRANDNDQELRPLPCHRRPPAQT
jgi:hypothetical protein